ncbi:hypothetical protein FA15DRAFT_65110 [Coprinopsis marcescibilis]|uniref:Uncharacterized protein n=1 Tax=Coprinopsis marcescibilis TaxID=230819 RepID=A0A5C3KMW5_COPMA|nr:hypothetical protein FA15DRAFT_65110 [Coprinopsis marcescibilis]
MAEQLLAVNFPSACRTCHSYRPNLEGLAWIQDVTNGDVYELMNAHLPRFPS